ncbi:MAG: 3-hydroxyacyl-CoA dehydrogenase NAD-binding domain-containing protein [Pirellulaceae bacterium]
MTQSAHNVSFLQQRNREDRGVDAPDVPVGKIDRVGIIGAGVMGCGIAAANIRNGLDVVITDASSDALDRCQPQILADAQAAVDAFSSHRETETELAARLSKATHEADVAGCDLIIESIVENLEVKRRVLARLGPEIRDEAILATNTSTFPVTQMASGLRRPERFCGIHFCNPVQHRRLVEVVRGERTDDITVATSVVYAKRLGKLPIVVKDRPGFLVNRLLLPYLNEAVELFCEGAPFEDLERVSRAFGMQMGPLEMYDMIGTDTSFYAGRTMWEAFRDRIVPSPVLPAMIKRGRLGQKSGLGFYSHASTPPVLDPRVPDLLSIYVREQRPFSDEQLTARLFLPMLLEATRALADGVVRDARDVDLGVIFGLGFPESKGGLLFWADSLGADTILQMLEPLKDLGPRFHATELLLRMASNSERFYEIG